MKGLFLFGLAFAGQWLVMELAFKLGKLSVLVGCP